MHRSSSRHCSTVCTFSFVVFFPNNSSCLDFALRASVMCLLLICDHGNSGLLLELLGLLARPSVGSSVTFHGLYHAPSQVVVLHVLNEVSGMSAIGVRLLVTALTLTLDSRLLLRCRCEGQFGITRQCVSVYVLDSSKI